MRLFVWAIFAVFATILTGLSGDLAVPAIAAPPPAPAAQTADVPGGKDPAFLKRYEGSKIIAYRTESYNTYSVAKPDTTKPPATYQFTGIEGQITRIVYQTGPDHSVLELLRNYEATLDEAGFTRLVELTEKTASPHDLAGAFYWQAWQPDEDFTWHDMNRGALQQAAYVSATATKDGKDITLAMFITRYPTDTDTIYQGKHYRFSPSQVVIVVDVISAKAVEIKMVQVKATDMADELAKNGVVDLYGILFDVDKTAIRPESDKTLDEVGTLLKIDRSLKLEISGHTDNTGDKDHNQKLSEGRAQAVVDVLVKKYGIDPGRLQPKGYGDTKPVAANDSDTNKAKNRRVELRKI